MSCTNCQIKVISQLKMLNLTVDESWFEDGLQGCNAVTVPLAADANIKLLEQFRSFFKGFRQRSVEACHLIRNLHHTMIGRFLGFDNLERSTTGSTVSVLASSVPSSTTNYFFRLLSRSNTHAGDSFADTFFSFTFL